MLMHPDLSLAHRVTAIPPFYVMEVVREAQALEAVGMDVIHLEIGEPDFATPTAVIRAAQDALLRGQTRYTDARGIAPLREAIAAWYATQGATVPAERIQITQGASAALLLAAAVTVNPGEQVLMADPSYPCNPRFVEAVGGQVHGVPTDASTRFQPTVEALEAVATPADRLLMLAHPANPTGMAVPGEALASMVSWCEQSGRHLLVDEIYLNLAFSPMQSSLLVSDRHFVAGSFSKYFNMTGWRLGWLVIPEHALEATQKLAQHLFICASSIAQEAALACFTPDVLAEADARCETLKARRDMLVPALESLGFKIAAIPDGAFYIFADASALTADASQFCLELIRHTGVAMTPGIDFSSRLPNHWVRIAYTQPIERLQDAIERIRGYLHGSL